MLALSHSFSARLPVLSWRPGSSRWQPAPSPTLAVDDIVGCDPDFIHATDNLLSLFGVNDVGAADPGDNFEAMVVNIPSLGITDVLTSGTDPSGVLADFGAPEDIAVGTAGVTLNTFIDPSLGIDSTSTIPFTDPLAPLWDFLVANSFFGL